MQLQLTSPHGLKHPVTQMLRGKGHKYNYKSYSGTFRCPHCTHLRWVNLNFLGHSGRIYCNGKVTKIQRDNHWDDYKTPEQLFEKAAK